MVRASRMTISVSSLQAEGDPLRSLNWPSDPNCTHSSRCEIYAPRGSTDSHIYLSNLPPARSSIQLLGRQDGFPSEVHNFRAQQQQKPTEIDRDPTYDHISTSRGWKWKHLIKDPSDEEPYRLRVDWATLRRITLLRITAIKIVTAWDTTHWDTSLIVWQNWPNIEQLY